MHIFINCPHFIITIQSLYKKQFKALVTSDNKTAYLVVENEAL